MRSLKKIISLILIISLLLTSVSFGNVNENYDVKNELITQKNEEIELSNKKAQYNEGYGDSVVFFENNGVHDKNVEYYANTLQGSIFYTKNGEVSFVFPIGEKEITEENYVDKNGEEKTPEAATLEYEQESNTETIYWAFKESFVSGKNVKFKADKESKAKYNYIIGDDITKHKKNIKGYKTINYGEVYDNIEIYANVNQESVEKIFDVLPGGNVNDIQVEISGISSLEVNDNEELVLNTEYGYMKLSAPIAYQVIDGEKVDVEVSYAVNNNVYGFSVGEYNTGYTLTIDPTYIASYFGGNADYTYINEITTDKDGYIYATGSAWFNSFPTTVGAYSNTVNGIRDVFVSKFDPQFQNLLASTLIGGSGNEDEAGQGIQVAENGNVYISGFTNTSDFPVAGAGYDSSLQARSAIIFIMNNSLDTLMTTTFIDETENAGDLRLESDGNILVGGNATYKFETTEGAFQRSSSMSYTSAFISRYSGDLSTLLDSTFLTSRGGDSLVKLRLSSNGDILIAGSTFSGNFPTTPNSFRDYSAGNWEPFGAIMSNDLTTLKAATLFGTSALDYGYDIAEDKEGNVYLVGFAGSGLPTTTGAYQESNNGERDGFIAKFDRNMEHLLAATYFGGEGTEECRGVVFTDSNEIVVIGETRSSSYPVTEDAYDTQYNGWDAFLTKFNTDLSEINYSTLWGGDYRDYAVTVHLDKDDTLYVAGRTNGVGMLTTPDVYQSNALALISMVLIISSDKTGLDAADTAKIKAPDKDNFIGFGSFSHSKKLLSVKGALDLSIGLNYNSILDETSNVGHRWVPNYDTSIREFESGIKEIVTEDGVLKTFADVEDGYKGLEDNYANDELAYEAGDGSYTLTSDRSVYAKYTNGQIEERYTSTGESVDYIYDINNRLDRIVESKSGNFIKINYKSAETDALIESVEDNSGRVVNLTYDASDVLETITDPEGVVTTFTYNSDNQLLTETLSNDTESYTVFTNTYDAEGRISTVDDNKPSYPAVEYTYDETSLKGHIIITKKDSLGNTNKSTFDANYNLVYSVDEENNVVVQNSYADGLLTLTEDAVGNEHSYSYYENGQLKTVTNPLGEVTEYFYYDNEVKSLKTVINTINGGTHYKYNSDNKVTEVLTYVTTDFLNAVKTEYFYDENGNLDYIVSPEGYRTDYTFGDNGQVEKVEHQSRAATSGAISISHTENYTYDSVGRVDSVTNGSGKTFDIEYYDDDKIMLIRNPLNETINYNYYAHGAVDKVIDYENEVTTYIYDDNFNIYKMKDPLNNETIYTYDGNDRLDLLTDRNGNYADYDYYKNGWLNKVTDALGNYKRYEYYANGKVSNIYAVDPNNAPSEIKIASYTYDGLNNVLTSTDALNNVKTNSYVSVYSSTHIT